jgi:hypothetical protein
MRSTRRAAVRLTGIRISILETNFIDAVLKNRGVADEMEVLHA